MSGPVAVIADVHGNLHALRAVLDRIRAAGVRTIVCAGDLVGYGPHPNECVELVAETASACVAGNHDLMAIGTLPVEGGRLIRQTQEWTRAQLRPDVRAYLAALPINLVAAEMVVAHGSLDDPTRYVAGEDDGWAEIGEAARRHPAARQLVLGHTHHRRVLPEGRAAAVLTGDARVRLELDRRYLLNPGSVGQSRDWMPALRARFMIADLDAGWVDCRSVEYDVAACRAALRERGLPPFSMHLPPGRFGRAAVYLRDALNA
jgi:predicted phosphodiesterase